MSAASRRSLLAGLAASPLAGILPTATPAAPAASPDVNGLWRDLLLAQGAFTAASRVNDDADLDPPAYKVFRCQQAIELLQPTSMNILAAQVMIETALYGYSNATADEDSHISLAVVALRGLLPHLSGDIAQDAAEFVENRLRRLDKMRAVVGILPNGQGDAA